MELLALSKIRTDGGTQSRAAFDEEWARELAGHLDDGADLPAVVVFYDGHDYWLADGFHRVRAYVLAERDEIPVDIRQGDQDDAVWFGAGANLLDESGRPRAKPATAADRSRAAEALARRFPGKTVREIAVQAGVSHTTVERIRARLAQCAKSVQTADPPPSPGASRKRDERSAARPPAPPKAEEIEDDSDPDDCDDYESDLDNAAEPDSVPESGPPASIQPPVEDEPPPAVPKESKSEPITETLKNCVRGLTDAERAELFMSIGVVPIEALAEISLQREADDEYHAWRQRETEFKTKFGASRPQLKIDFVLAGGEIALAVLGLDYTVTPERLAEAYKAAARAAHPDRKGGDSALMSALNQAHTIVKAFVEAM